MVGYDLDLTKKARPGGVMPTPEFGPAPYQQLLPYTQAPVADLALAPEADHCRIETRETTDHAAGQFAAVMQNF